MADRVYDSNCNCSNAELVAKLWRNMLRPYGHFRA
jgi:hypothetical protein